MAFQSKNPITGELKLEKAFTEQKNLLEQIKKADEAFQAWRKLSFTKRAQYLNRLADSIDQKSDHLAHLITFEMGKPLREALAEVQKSAATARYYSENAENMLAGHRFESHPDSEVIFQPLGVIFGIFPWNYPVWQVMRFAIPTLMAGNAVLFKQAENTPQCALETENLFREAGFPEGLVQNLFARVEDVEFIVAQPEIKATTLTGSERAGKSVASISGKYLKKTVLELGGSDPCLIFPDADLKKAAKIAALSRFQNTGQSCIAAKRFVVHEEVYPSFRDLFVEEMGHYQPGDPFLMETRSSCLARPDLADLLEQQVDESIRMGARRYCGAQRLDHVHFEAGILEDIPETAPAFSQELFGPVAGFYAFRHTEEAIRLANATSFGLGASVWTNNIGLARELAREIESGMVYLNSLVRSTPELPFGGIKNSGIGRELSPFGIREFTNIKLIYS